MRRSPKQSSGYPSRARKQADSSGSPVEILQAPLLAQFPWLVHGFSTRRGGVSTVPPSRKGAELNLGTVQWDRAENVRENRLRLLASLDAPEMKLKVLRQIHSDLIRIVDQHSFPPGPPPAGDGLLTSRPGFLLAVLVADCLPILLLDARQRIVAALHCGWRGTARRLAQKGAGILQHRCGSRAKDLWAAIGPGIRACCYQVGPDVVEEFQSQFHYADRLILHRTHVLSPLEIKRSLLTVHSPIGFGPNRKQDFYLDLVAANVWQLREAGVPASQIGAEGPCTNCHPEMLFSHRRDAARAGRMMGVIGIRDCN